QRIDGFLFEWGPSGFLASADELRALVREVGLDDALTQAGPAAKNRFIYWHGRLHKLPAKPPQMLAMSLLSPGGKLRALGELFAGPRAGHDRSDDESVYRFMERRFGREVAERIAAPALLGISGGDAASTSLAAVFPRVPNLEREYGSVIRGMVREKRKPGAFCTFADGGMERLTERIAERLGSRLRLGAAVRRIERRAAGWRIVHDGGEACADGVIVAAPADVAANLLEGVDAALAAHLRGIAYAPMRAIGIAFRGADVPAPLDGFGFLVARGGGVRILGATYTSTIVPEHAPAGSVYLRIFMGGAGDPEAAVLDAAAARTLVRADLATVLGITAEPIAYHEVTWQKAIPQYGLRHRATVKAIEEITAAHAGLALTGNAYRGLGVGDTVSDARAVARGYIL
ncbi:MAG TPA: protoporphyrinogen oxidase, partial [Candidatus Lustribacter sp.]